MTDLRYYDTVSEAGIQVFCGCRIKSGMTKHQQSYETVNISICHNQTVSMLVLRGLMRYQE